MLSLLLVTNLSLPVHIPVVVTVLCLSLVNLFLGFRLVVILFLMTSRLLLLRSRRILLNLVPLLHLVLITFQLLF